MKLIIVRHAETTANKDGVLQGHTDHALSSDGHAQARAVAERLQNESIDAVYISDLKRTCQTADHVIEHHTAADVVYTEKLREQDVGVFQGRPLQQKIDAQDAAEESFAAFTPENGESFQDVQGRVSALYEEIGERHTGETVLLISHGGAITTLLLHFFDKPLNVENFTEHVHDNTGVTVVEVDENEEHVLHRLNCTAHLEDS